MTDWFSSAQWVSGLSLHWPWMLALLPVPWLLRFLTPAVEDQSDALRTPLFDRLSASNRHDDRSPTTLLSGLRPALLVALWLALVLAASRPVWHGNPEAIQTSGRDLMLAVDISDSMRVDDMQMNGEAVTRLTAVKQVVADFVSRRGSDRIGLILFGHQSFVQAPLTFDHRTVTVQLNEAMAGFAGSATAIGDMMGLVVKTLRGRKADSRVLVLLTDGANTAGSDPKRAAEIAAQANIRIHTIAIGAAGRVVGNPSGETRWLDASEELDMPLLQLIARTTGGQYFRAHNAQEMTAVYQAVDELEPSPAPQTFRPQRSLYHWPLAAALLVSVFLAFVVVRPVASVGV